MRGLLAIYQRELRGYFISPIAYVVMVVFLVLVGLFFMNLLRQYISFDGFVRERMLTLGQEPQPASVHLYLYRKLVVVYGALTLFVIPFITMGSFADEHRTGTMELLLTSPVGQRDIVIAKFLAASTIYVVLLALTLVLVSVSFLFGNPHAPTVLVGFLGLFLQGESFLVIGLFISSLTRSQVVAGIGGLGAAGLLWLVGLVADPSSTFGRWLQDLSLVSHFEDFSKGIIDSKHLSFYCSVIFFGLFATLRSVESLKYR